MMLAQAMVLADLRDESADTQVQGGESLVQAGCYVLETMLALADGGQITSITVDAATFPTGDVGEWDPFINFLEQGQSTTACNMSLQLPPSRTGSTFKALVQVMAILRKTRHPYSNPQVLAEDLQAWGASLPADVRGAIIAEATQARTPVPSKLNLRSWYGIVYGMIARLRQGVPGSASNRISGSLALHGMGALHVAGREYGLSMLPATSGILFWQVSKLPDAMLSPPDAVPGAYSHLATGFLDHWECKGTNRGVQSYNPRIGVQGLNTNMHQPLILPSLTEGSTRETTDSECQVSASGHSQYTVDAPAGPVVQSGVEAVGDVNATHPFSQWRSTSHAPASSVDPSAATNAGIYMEGPPSYDLLEYLTMFENENWYVEERRWLGPPPWMTIY
jgi:hypothetical protein